jgi:hypothetical protein
MNLNVDPATKQRLRELWKPIAADHYQGEIIDLLVARWGSEAAAELARRDDETPPADNG